MNQQRLSTIPSSVRPVLEEARGRLADLYGDRLLHVILYGSHARGNADPESDVDVLVVLREGFDLYTELKRLTHLKLRLLDRYDVYVTFQPFTKTAYQDLRRPLMQNVHAEGIEL